MYKLTKVSVISLKDVFDDSLAVISETDCHAIDPLLYPVRSIYNQAGISRGRIIIIMSRMG